MSSENKCMLRKASHVAACNCCLCSTDESANKRDCQKQKGEGEEGKLLIESTDFLYTSIDSSVL